MRVLIIFREKHLARIRAERGAEDAYGEAAGENASLGF